MMQDFNGHLSNVISYSTCVVGRITDSQRCPGPSLWNLEYIIFIVEGTLQIWLNEGLWGEDIILDYLADPNLIIWFHKSRALLVVARGRYEYGRMFREIQDSVSVCCWFWRWKKGSISWGMWVVFRSLKRQENEFSHRVFRKKHSPANTLILTQLRPMPGF